MIEQSSSREVWPGTKAEFGGDTKAATKAPAVWFLAGRLSAEGPVQYIPIGSESFYVGRRSDSSLCLASKRVSSRHAELLDMRTAVILRDLGSTNGTFVNGNRVIEPVFLSPDDLIQFADVPFRVMQQSIQYNAATAQEDMLDQAMVLVLLDKLMNERAVVPYYQPIVNLEDGGVLGFEALARSELAQLETPGAMFSAAAHLGLEVELSQIMRLKAVQETSSFANPPHLFLNTHPSELEKPGLVDSIKSLRAIKRSQKITLEIHERAVSDCRNMRTLREQLQELDVDLAFDDFGAGQARLVELVDVHPQYLKFDMSFIRGIHAAPRGRQRLVASLVRMSRDVGAIPLAEGIECEAERDACRRLGFQLAQGFYFGRPVPLNERPCDIGAPVARTAVISGNRH